MHFQQPLVIPCKYLVSKAFCCVSLKQQGQGASLLAANGAISEEQRIMSAAAPTDAKRFQAPVSLISMGGTHTEMGDSNPVGRKVSEASYVHSGECARRKKQYYFSVLTNTLVETEFFNLWAFMLMQRKREALQIDAKTAAAAAMDEKEVLWHVNYEEFVRRLRHQVRSTKAHLNIFNPLSKLQIASLCEK
jgi:hypothetical protein